MTIDMFGASIGCGIGTGVVRLRLSLGSHDHSIMRRLMDVLFGV